MCRWVSHFHLCSFLFFLSHPSFPTNSPDLRRVGGVQRRRFGLVALEGKIRKAALSCWTAAQGTWRDLAAPRLCSEELGFSFGVGGVLGFCWWIELKLYISSLKMCIWNPVGHGETGWFGRTVFFLGGVPINTSFKLTSRKKFGAGYSTPQKSGNRFQLKHFILEVDGCIFKNRSNDGRPEFLWKEFSLREGSKPVRFWFLLGKPPTRAIAIGDTFTPLQPKEDGW